MASLITMLALASVASGGHQHLGCWNNHVYTNRDRGVHIYRGNGMGVNQCAERCNGHPLFGIENGGECWCEDSKARAQRRGKDTGCVDGKGAAYKFDLYEV